MNNAQQDPHSTANYISIILLTVVAFSGTAYIIFYAVMSPPFDVELSIKLEGKNEVQCATKEAIKRNIPYEIAEHREEDWIVLSTIEDKNEMQPILANKCSLVNQ